MPDVSKTSSDYDAMVDYWTTVRDLSKGAKAVRDARERYLPRFENETLKQYNDRVIWARYTNVYGDILGNLAAKPFSEEVTLVDAPSEYQTMVEDIDGQGNNLHNFAGVFFKNAINYAIDWIFVDYTRVNPNTVDANGRVRRKSVAEERQTGARPYWTRVSALEMIAVYSAVIHGVEHFVHCRMLEHVIELNADYEEVPVEYIRELSREPIYDTDEEVIGFAPAVWRLWRKGDDGYEVVEDGEVLIGIIPIVPLIIGEREGLTWRIDPAMQACADLQIDLYQQEAGLQNARLLTAFPMLSADGVDPEMEDYIDDAGNARQRPRKAPVGPRTVLYGGRGADGSSPGSWKYVEMQGNSLKFLSDEIKATTQELRELGRQPLTAQTGNLTVITTAFAAQKGNSAVKNWALALKDALELAFRYSSWWMKGTNADGPSVNVYTDFEEGIGQDDGFDDVLAMRKEGDLSQETLWEEAKRRKRLGDEFNAERERKRLDEEGSGPLNEQDMIDALGNITGDDDDADPDGGDDDRDGMDRVRQ